MSQSEPIAPTASGPVSTKHNEPPQPILAVRAEVAKLVDNANTWIKAVPILTTEEQATRLEDFLQQLRGWWKKVDEQRKALKKPHDDAIAEIQGDYNPQLALLKTCADALAPLKTAWLLELQKRQDDERARAAEAESKAKAEAAEALAKAEGNLAEDAEAIMVAVDSTNIRKIGYDAEAKRLFIMFPAALWVYRAVPPNVHAALMAADSKGSYFAREIKGKFESQMVAALSVQDQVAADAAQKNLAKATQANTDAQSAKATVKGDFSKRATGLRTVWRGQITDFDKALQHYKAQPEVREIIQQLANADARRVKGAMDIPGIEQISEQKA